MRYPFRNLSLAVLALLGAISLLAQAPQPVTGVFVAAPPASGSCTGSGVKVCGVTGTLTEGQSVSLSGVNFGATGPTVVVFDNFEGGTTGAQINVAGATTGSWRTSAPPANRPVYSTDQAVSGTKSAKVDTTGPNNDNGIPASLGSTSDAFAVWSMKAPAGDRPPGSAADQGNLKIFWLYQTGTTDNDITVAWAGSTSPTYPINNWSMFGNDTPITDYQWFDATGCAANHPGCVSSDFDLNNGSWYRMQEYHHASATRGSAENQFAFSNKDIPTAYASHYNSTWENVFPGFVGWQEWVVNGFNRTSSPGPARIYYDDVYMATSTTKGAARARVEVGNASTYATCTNLAIFPTTAWSSTSITATVRKGSFTTGSFWIFVHDLNGNVSAGFPITL